MLAPPLSVREAAAARRLPAVPAITQAATKGMPAQLGVDRLFVDLVRRSHDHRAVRRRLVVVETLVVDGHAEEARGPVGQVARVLLFDGPANGLFALVDAEHELRSGALGARLDRQGSPRRQGVEDRVPVGALVGILEELAPVNIAESGALGPQIWSGRRHRATPRDRATTPPSWRGPTAAKRRAPESAVALRDPGLAAQSIGLRRPRDGRRAPRRRARAGAARPGTPRGMTGGLQGDPPGDARAARTCRSSLATPER